MLCPYGRRVIALIGANGVGRRTLKKMLIEYRPYEFAGVVPSILFRKLLFFK